MAWVQFAQQNTVKTANQNSRINFYFVTSFYSLYDIYMADGVRIRSSCLGKRQSRAVSCELCAKAHCDLGGWIGGDAIAS